MFKGKFYIETNKMRSYQKFGGLKPVVMDGQLIRSDSILLLLLQFQLVCWLTLDMS